MSKAIYAKHVKTARQPGVPGRAFPLTVSASFSEESAPKAIQHRELRLFVERDELAKLLGAIPASEFADDHDLYRAVLRVFNWLKSDAG